MKILRIARTALPVKNGASIHIHHLSNAQVDLGHNVLVLTPYKLENLSEKPYRYDRRIIGGFQYDWMGVPGTEHILFKSKLFALFYYLKIVFSIKMKDYDVLHIHGDLLDIIFVPIYKILAPKSKVCLTLHGGVSESKLYKKLMAIFMQSLNGLIAVNEHIITDLEVASNEGLMKKTLVQSSGVDKDFFRIYGDRAASTDNIKLIFVGRLHKVKGVSILLEACKSLGKKFKLEIYGDGPELNNLIAMSHTFKDRPSVQFFGTVPTFEVFSKKASRAILIIPSVKLTKQKEGFPTIALEAMAAGMPIIASDAAGLSAILPEDQIFKSGDVPALVNTLNSFDFATWNAERLHNYAKSQEWVVVSRRITSFLEAC
jgi:glycosyltransferase involved in cell wall biosynthesis